MPLHGGLEFVQSACSDPSLIGFDHLVLHTIGSANALPKTLHAIDPKLHKFFNINKNHLQYKLLQW